MAGATLNLSVVEKRMLTATEAASYMGLAAKHFKDACPVRPVEIRKGDRRWDKRDLDHWIDGLKEGVEMTARDDILGRL